MIKMNTAVRHFIVFPGLIGLSLTLSINALAQIAEMKPISTEASASSQSLQTLFPDLIELRKHPLWPSFMAEQVSTANGQMSRIHALGTAALDHDYAYISQELTRFRSFAGLTNTSNDSDSTLSAPLEPTTPSPSMPDLPTLSGDTPIVRGGLLGTPKVPAPAYPQTVDPANAAMQLLDTLPLPRPQQPSMPDPRVLEIQRQAAINEHLTLTNCSGNGFSSAFSSAPTKTALSLALCRYHATGHPVEIHDYQCTSLDNGFYKCFVSQTNDNDRTYKVRYTNGLWKIYQHMK
ncbi:hypothetical protein [Acetobacter cibinongensis]|uniref:hypothetical protein n=1 Tax=Acetobacter cibinongensis TaxID=146475 RepID=UPI00105557DF|nr:hypothetical protein [Acetobacter cibinongensis]